MKSLMMVLGALALVAGGCSPILLEPVEGTEEPSPPSGPGSHVLAIRGGDVNWVNKFYQVPDIPPDPAPFWTDPDSLVLFFSNDIQECSDPMLAKRCTGPEPERQTMIAIPSKIIRPGLIDLQDPGIVHFATDSYHLGPRSYFSWNPGDKQPWCGHSQAFGGGGPDGTLEILSHDSTSVSLRLHGAKYGGSWLGGDRFTYDIEDGDYTALLCSPFPPAAPPTPAFAIRGANLSGVTGTAPLGGGATPDPDTLFVLLGTPPQTCQDSLPSDYCVNDSHLTFRLPLALQKPGLLDLFDPAIAASYSVKEGLGPITCGPSWPFERGTVEIVSIDASSLSFRVYGSFAHHPLGGSFGLDGLYTAAICP